MWSYIFESVDETVIKITTFKWRLFNIFVSSNDFLEAILIIPQNMSEKKNYRLTRFIN